MPDVEMISVYGKIVQETDKAILLDLNIGDEPVWLPKSEIEYCGDVDDETEVSMPDWLAAEKSLSDGDGFPCDSPTNQENQEAEEEPDEPEASTVPGDTNWLGQETITVSEQLTTEEKSEYAEEMASLDKEIEDLEDERDRISKSLKKQIDGLEDERRRLSKVVREGEAVREVFCDKIADYNTLEIVWTDAMPPHEEISRRKMTESERQPPLIMNEKPEPDLDPAEGEEGQAEGMEDVTLSGTVKKITENELDGRDITIDFDGITRTIHDEEVEWEGHIHVGDTAAFTMYRAYAIVLGLIVDDETPQEPTSQEELAEAV